MGWTEEGGATQMLLSKTQRGVSADSLKDNIDTEAVGAIGVTVESKCGPRRLQRVPPRMHLQTTSFRSAGQCEKTDLSSKRHNQSHAKRPPLGREILHRGWTF